VAAVRNCAPSVGNGTWQPGWTQTQRESFPCLECCGKKVALSMSNCQLLLIEAVPVSRDKLVEIDLPAK
jgi:hypothetical protein